MSESKTKSFNGQVYEKTYKRLKLSPTQRVIFQRLLGFLIRNDKSFPFSAVKMTELTGYDKRTVFRVLDRLENLRLIKRTGLGANRRFSRGSILNKILTTVTNRQKEEQSNNFTTTTLCRKNLNNRDTVSYSKTSSSLKHKERGRFELPSFSQEQIKYQVEYVNRIMADRALGLKSGDVEIMSFDQWIKKPS